jgi:hypothetical protein
MPSNLTRIETEVYELIKKSGEINTTNLPFKLRGVVPQLIKKGLVEAYKRPTSPWTHKKKKFLKVKENEPNKTIT